MACHRWASRLTAETPEPGRVWSPETSIDPASLWAQMNCPHPADLLLKKTQGSATQSVPF